MIRALVVDDNAMLAKVSALALNKLSVRVDFAVNGDEAVTKAMDHVYDLILMDVEMPVMDGLEATKRLREQGYAGLIVATTALTAEKDPELCIEAGCDMYLAKPLEQDSIRKVVESLASDALYSTILDDPEMSAMVSEFVAILPDRIDEILQILRRKDSKRLAEATRTLKSEGSTFGFAPITEVAEAIETKLLEGVDVNVVRPQVRQLIKLCQNARPAGPIAGKTD